jgi:hypothetical protein
MSGVKNQKSEIRNERWHSTIPNEFTRRGGQSAIGGLGEEFKEMMKPVQLEFFHNPVSEWSDRDERPAFAEATACQA